MLREKAINTGSITSGHRSTLNSTSRRLLIVAALLCKAGASSALTPSQQQRAQNLYPKFIAPCCWRQSVAVHQSPQAIHVRTEIDQGIAAGKNDDQIKSDLIREYGHGILMEPEGIRAFIAYSGPLLALTVGLLVFLKWVKRNVKPTESSDSALHPIAADFLEE